MLYNVTIDGCDDAKKLRQFHALEKVQWEPGETVTFFVMTATDTDYRVTSAQAAVHCEEYSVGGMSTFSFVMPEEDVDVIVESRSSMTRLLLTNPPAMGMMGMPPVAMADLMGAAAAPAEPAADEHPWEGKPAFCAECGASTKHSNKYCAECGARLLPKE